MRAIRWRSSISSVVATERVPKLPNNRSVITWPKILSAALDTDFLALPISWPWCCPFRAHESGRSGDRRVVGSNSAIATARDTRAEGQPNADPIGRRCAGALRAADGHLVMSAIGGAALRCHDVLAEPPQVSKWSLSGMRAVPGRSNTPCSASPRGGRWRCRWPGHRNGGAARSARAPSPPPRRGRAR